MESYQKKYKETYYRIRFSPCSGAWMDSDRTSCWCSDLSVPPGGCACQSNSCSLHRWICGIDLRILRRYLLYLSRYCKKISHCCQFSTVHFLQIRQQNTPASCPLWQLFYCPHVKKKNHQ